MITAVMSIKMKGLKMNSLRHITAISAALVFLSACSLTPDYQRPEIETPAWQDAQSIQNAEIAADWWTNFESAELNALMKRALGNNNNLQASLQRIEQARADLKIAGAALLPSADITATYMSGSIQATNITDMRNKGIPDYTVDAGISYELDLFGANRAKANAAEDRLLSVAYKHDALALVIMGDVAQNYFNILNLKERVRIANDNLQATQDLLKVAKARFQTGVRTQLDITRQETQVARAKAAVTALEQELALTQNALAVLIGEPPQSFSINGKNLNKLNLPDPAALQPAALLERRPDVKSMEAMLKAANADIGAARAVFYPSLNIGPSLLLAASPSASALTLAGSVSAPIFQGGRLKGNLDRVTARQKELAENYQQTVLVAFQEAENALTKVQKTLERENALRQATTKAREAYDIAKNQYSLSVIEFQDVLDSQRMMLESEDQYEHARYETLAARIELFKAMGGGWKKE
jgi:multidrug efflux system outer membrane protein